jgi:hypothetical protein
MAANLKKQVAELLHDRNCQAEGIRFLQTQLETETARAEFAEATCEELARHIDALEAELAEQA